tara:strand:+ start:37 stop:465 length:429 start_codon:yes stop_codon:yes gene_type:complete
MLLLDRIFILVHLIGLYILYQISYFLYKKIYSFYLLLFEVSIILDILNKNDLIEKYITLKSKKIIYEGKLKSIFTFSYDIEYCLFDLKTKNVIYFPLSEIDYIYKSKKYKDLYNWRICGITKKIPYDINYEIEKFICYQEKI